MDTINLPDTEKCIKINSTRFQRACWLFDLNTCWSLLKNRNKFQKIFRLDLKFSEFCFEERKSDFPPELRRTFCSINSKHVWVFCLHLMFVVVLLFRVHEEIMWPLNSITICMDFAEVFITLTPFLKTKLPWHPQTTSIAILISNYSASLSIAILYNDHSASLR